MINQINESISKLIKEGNDPIRQSKSYSFGNFAECAPMLTTAVQATDRSVDRLIITPAIEEMTKWMTDTKGKGLLLVGPAGTGKTMLLHTIPVLFLTMFSLKIHYKNANSITPDDFGKLLCIDDVGTENTISDYGIKRDYFQEYVCHCEEKFWPLFISTNLTGEELNSRYDTRITDRLSRLCHPIRFEGKSMRK